MHLHVPAACALYDASEDGCILHPKHVEQGKCNKVTLNNLHQAGLNKPTDFPLKAVFLVNYHLTEKSPGKLTLGSCKNRRSDNIKNVSYEIWN